MGDFNPNCGKCGGLNAWGFCSYTACRFPVFRTSVPDITSHLFYLTTDNLPKKVDDIYTKTKKLEQIKVTERTDISKMDAYEFLMARKRLCDSVEGNCGNCILDRLDGCEVCGYPHAIEGDYSDISFSAVQVVSAWSEKHPVVTNGDKFQEIFGDLVPEDLLETGANGISWWNTEYKEPQK